MKKALLRIVFLPIVVLLWLWAGTGTAVQLAFAQGTRSGVRGPDTQLLNRIEQVREEWRQLSMRAQHATYPDDRKRRDLFDRLLRANQNLRKAEAAAQGGDRVSGDRYLGSAQSDLAAAAQRLEQLGGRVTSPSPSPPRGDPSVSAGVVKEMVFALVPGSEFVGGLEVGAELLNAAPAALAHKWNTMFAVANPGWGDPPQIDQGWALNHRPQMIALAIALERLQRRLEGRADKVTPANFPKYQELIGRARRMWP